MIYIQLRNDIYPSWRMISNSIYHILKDSYDCTFIETATDWDKYSITENDTLICFSIFFRFINCVKIVNKIKLFVINTEPFISTNYIENIYNICSIYDKSIVNVLDYSIQNINILKSKNINCTVYYMPPTYNSYFETLFTSDSNIGSIENFDVLIYGWINNCPRRKMCIDSLVKSGINVKYFEIFSTIEEQIAYIKKAKIILNIYSYENNNCFDYYRLSLLLSNNILILTEKFSVDKEFEKNLLNNCLPTFTFDLPNRQTINYKKIGKYDDVTDKVKYYLAMSQEERDTVANKSGKWFKNSFDYKEHLIKIISQ